VTEPSHAVFLSYASQDAQAAQRICQALRAAGIEVWFDQSELRGGDVWDQKIRREIGDCALFIPVISANTAARHEGYFRLEWDLADQRTHMMARNRVFIVPVCLDASSEGGTDMPESFQRAQWTRLPPEGEAPPAFVERVQRLLSPEPSTRTRSPASTQSEAVGTMRAPVRASWSPKRGLFVAFAAALLLAVAYFAVEKPWASKSAASPQGTSLAVLPFADMSPQHDQEYFSDGLSEELLNQLAQIKDLKVAGRTSSFSFKGKNDDLRLIGEKLGVNHLLEGSVRKDGTQLRITAQLINAATGAHMWSQTYDRKLEKVFSVQEDIAKDVAGALSIALDVGDMSRAKGGTNNLEAYDKYLRAQDFYDQAGPANFQRSIQLSHEAVALDPNFARAWYALYGSLEQTLIYVPQNAPAISEEMNEVTARIVALTPDAWWTQQVRAAQATRHQQWSAAETASHAALASAPSTEHVGLGYGVILQELGRINEGLGYIQRAREVDPLSLTVSFSLQMALDTAGRPDDAEAEYERSRDLAGNHAGADNLALRRMLLRTEPDVAALKSRLREFLQSSNQASLFGITPDNLTNKQAVLATLHQQFNDPARQFGNPLVLMAGVADLYGDRDLAFAAFRRGFVDLHATAYLSFWPVNKSGLHADPRFKQLVRDLGFADYFRSTGKWNDFCHPVGKDDFECH
jgi:TolB-like protein